MNTRDMLSLLISSDEIALLNKGFSEPYSNCFVGILIPDKQNPTMILVIDQLLDADDPDSETLIKLPGGSGEKEDHDPYMTMMREAKQEVMGGTPGIAFKSVYPIYKKSIRGRDPQKANHEKWCVVVETNKLVAPYVHMEKLHIDERGRRTNEVISNHRYMPVSELARVVFYSHGLMIRRCCELLEDKDPEFHYALDILDHRKII